MIVWLHVCPAPVSQGSAAVAMVGLSYAMVPLYKIFCAVRGPWEGGQGRGAGKGGRGEWEQGALGRGGGNRAEGREVRAMERGGRRMGMVYTHSRICLQSNSEPATPD